MSVFEIKTELVSEINSKANKLDLNLTLGSSQIAIAFTSNFSLVSILTKDTTVINIFRPASRCIGTPFNSTSTLQTSQTLILCECIEANRVNKLLKKASSGGSATNRSATNGTATNGTTNNGTANNGTANNGTGIPSNTGNISITNTSNHSFADFPKDHPSNNYKTWLITTVAIISIITLVVIIALIFEKALITPFATMFFTKISVRLMVSQQTKVIQHDHKKDDKEKQKSKENKKTDDMLSKSSDSNKPNDHIDKLKKAFKDNKLVTSCLNSPSATNPLSGIKLLGIVYLTNHYALSILFSKCIDFNRKSIISNFYTRVYYNMALTMVLGMGLGKQGYSNYTKFVATCLLMPFASGFIMVLVKKLMRYDNHFNFLSKCTKKSNVDSKIKDMSRANIISPKDSIVNNRGHNSVFPRSSSKQKSIANGIPISHTSSRSTHEFLDSNSSPTITSGHSPLSTNNGSVSPKQPLSVIEQIKLPFF